MENAFGIIAKNKMIISHIVVILMIIHVNFITKNKFGKLLGYILLDSSLLYFDLYILKSLFNAGCEGTTLVYFEIALLIFGLIFALLSIVFIIRILQGNVTVGPKKDFSEFSEFIKSLKKSKIVFYESIIIVLMMFINGIYLLVCL